MPFEDSTISKASRTNFSNDDAALASSEFNFASNCSAIAVMATNYCRSVPLATLRLGPSLGPKSWSWQPVTTRLDFWQESASVFRKSCRSTSSTKMSSRRSPRCHDQVNGTRILSENEEVVGHRAANNIECDARIEGDQPANVSH